MVDTDPKGGKVSWVFGWDNETTLVLAGCGPWEAQLAKDVYSKGQVFIVPKKKAPDFLGDETREIPEPEALIRLIENVSIVMVRALPNCTKVYLVSLNEGGGPLHFWLIPLNDSEHKDFLDSKDGEDRDNDGFTLMAELRNKFVDRKRSGKWGTMPPCPPNKEWRKYAEDYKKKFRNVRRRKAKNTLSTERKLKIGCYLATCILAVIAIFSLIFSIIASRSTSKTSQRTTQTLKDMQQELAYFNQAYIKIDSCGWYKEGEISCNNPPVGIYANVRNFSNVPVKVCETSIRVFYGEKELEDAVSEIGGGTSHILPPGEVFDIGTVQKKFFQKYLGVKKSILVPPFLRVELRVVFSRLDSDEQHSYEAIRNIGFDCSVPDVLKIYPVEEQISRVTD